MVTKIPKYKLDKYCPGTYMLFKWLRFPGERYLPPEVCNFFKNLVFFVVNIAPKKIHSNYFIVISWLFLCQFRLPGIRFKGVTSNTFPIWLYYIYFEILNNVIEHHWCEINICWPKCFTTLQKFIYAEKLLGDPVQWWALLLWRCDGIIGINVFSRRHSIAILPLYFLSINFVINFFSNSSIYYCCLAII